MGLLQGSQSDHPWTWVLMLRKAYYKWKWQTPLHGTSSVRLHGGAIHPAFVASQGNIVLRGCYSVIMRLAPDDWVISVAIVSSSLRT